MKRRADKRHFGFTNADEAALALKKKHVPSLKPEPEDLIHYGLIPEFVGRLPVVSVLASLSEEDLVHILTKPRNCLVSQYRKLFAMDNIDLQFEDDAIQAMAKEALKRNTGARGLRSIMEELMIDVMYDASSLENKSKKTKLVITATMVNAQLSHEAQLVDLIKGA